MNKIETVFEAIASHAKTIPNKPAIIVGKEVVTYSVLAKKVNAIANSLHMLGVKPGDRVGVGMGNVTEYLMGWVGTMAAGGIPIALPQSDHLSCAAIIMDAMPVLVMGLGPDQIGPVGREIMVYSFNEILENAPESPVAFIERKVEPEEIAMILYTSGTTSGVRKGVMQTYRALHNTANYIVNIMHLTDAVCEFVASPIDTAFWIGRCRCVLKVGGTLLLHNGTLNPLGIVSAVNKNNGNSISGDTPVFMLLMKHVEKGLRQISPMVRWVKMASQAMPIKDKEHIRELFPGARIYMNYGLTEAMRTSILPFEEYPDKLGSVGRPSQGVSVAILDNSEGSVLPPNQVGEVLISGANLASGYWNKEQMWAEKFIGDWYKSGDFGYLDDDGFLFLVGRKDHAINSGGKTIALNEVEDRIRPYMVTSSFAACGMPDPNGILGEIVVLCVEDSWKEEKEWKDLRILLLEHVDPAFVPRDAYCVQAFPRTVNGKIQIGILRKQLEQGLCHKC